MIRFAFCLAACLLLAACIAADGGGGGGGGGGGNEGKAAGLPDEQNAREDGGGGGGAVDRGVGAGRRGEGEDAGESRGGGEGEGVRGREGGGAWIPAGRLFGGLPIHLGHGAGDAAAPPSLEELLGSLERGFGGARAHVLQLPAAFNGVIADVMSGALGGARNVEYSFRDGRKLLVAKINMPAAHGGRETSRRRIHIAVVGSGSRLHVKVETLAAGSEMIFEHVLRLPVRVTQEGIETVANPEGSATVTLRVIGELPEGKGDGVGGMEGRGRFPLPLPASAHSLADMLFGDSSAAQRFDEADENATDVVQTLPSAADVEACRRRYAGTEYRLQARHCVCRTSPTESGRALCFAGVLSSAIKIARRLGKGGEATEAKHAAMDCAGHAAGHAQCLQSLSAQFLTYIYGDVDHGERKELSERIRAAIESEDDGGGERPRATAKAVIVVLVLTLFALCCLIAALFKVVRQFIVGNSASGGSSRGMTSVLSQRAASGGNVDPRKRPGGPPRTVGSGKLA